MNIRERMELFWSGERPDQIPYTIYQNEWRHTADDPAWLPMYEQGLGVTWHLPSVKTEASEVEITRKHYRENGQEIMVDTMRSPAGEVYQTHVDGWHDKYYLETAEDYAVMIDIVRRTEVLPDYAGWLEKDKQIGPYGIPQVALGRTPLQIMLVDFAGLEKFAYHLFDFQAEVEELYQALLDKLRRSVALVAEGPGRFVSVLENFTADSLGPRRFKQYLLSVYEELFPILRSAGKIVGTHYDGRLASCKELIAGAPIDLIESFTTPPEGDMSLVEAREIWPDKLLWSNINVANYYLPPEQLHDIVLKKVAEGAVDGKLFALEVSEQYPENWRTSLPVVLKALEETRI